MFATLIALALSSAPAVTVPPVLVSGPRPMKMSEIRAYNRSLGKDHPNYIRCKRVEETRSLVKKQTTCRTNQEWGRVDTAGNQEARDAVEGLQKGWSNGK